MELSILGTRITEQRKKCNLTQEALAKEIGVSASAVSKWESGASIPDLAMLCTLADLFHISADYLLGRTPSNQFLICDDSYFMGSIITDMLHHSGYAARAFANSEQLFNSLEHITPLGILLDVHFPNENGLDILKQLKEQHPSIPVIMLTADMSEEVHATALSYGAQGFIYKPFSAEHLQTAIESVF